MPVIKKYKIWFIWFLLAALLLAVGSLTNASESQAIPQQCKTNCTSRYGLELGSSPAGITAYSNCNSDCVIFDPHHFEDIYTGIKWQCVEYARRWLLHEFNVVYGDVDIAADIWNIDQVTNPITGQAFKFSSVVNGSQSKPQRGDLLVYAKDYLGTGHVAIVVGINEERETLQLAEQNYFNTKWDNNFSREISFITKGDKFWLLDAYLIGWKRVMQKADKN